MDVAALIDRYDAAWNAQDLDAVTALHDDAIVFENHTAGERAEGAARSAPTSRRSSRAGRRSGSSAARCAAAPTSP